MANGNRVTVKGSPDSSDRSARRVLEGLYERARQGRALTPGDVDGAIQESTLQGSLFPTAEARTGGLTLRPDRHPQTRPRPGPQRRAERLSSRR